MTARIDMHAHFYGGGLAEMLHARRSRPCLRRRDDGGQDMLAMNGAFPFTPDHHDIAVGLAQMDRHGLTHRMLTFPGALGLDVLPAQEEFSGSAHNWNISLGFTFTPGGR